MSATKISGGKYAGRAAPDHVIYAGQSSGYYLMKSKDGTVRESAYRDIGSLLNEAQSNEWVQILPAGTGMTSFYYLRTTVQLKSGMVITGISRTGGYYGTVILLDTTSPINGMEMIWSSPSAAKLIVVLKDFFLRGKGDQGQTSGNGIHIEYTGTEAPTTNQFILDNVYLYAWPSYGLYSTVGKHWHVNNCRIRSCYTGGAYFNIAPAGLWGKMAFINNVIDEIRGFGFKFVGNISGPFLFTGNRLVANYVGGAIFNILTDLTSEKIISNNAFIANSKQGTGAGSDLVIQTGENYIINNNSIGFESKTKWAGNYGIDIASGVTGIATGNDVGGIFEIKNLRCQSDDFIIVNNRGINPIGVITNPFKDSPAIIGLTGTASGPTANELYEVRHCDVILKSSGQTGGNVQIFAPDGTTVLEELGTSAFTRHIPRGHKINFGGFTSGPTVTVSAS